jgi:predicted nucleic acid-binding protein
MPDGGRFYYFDTVTLSNFALVHRLDLLTGRYGGRLHITPEVLGEIMDGIAAGYSALGAIESALDVGAIRLADPLSPAERRIYQRLLRILSPGEASCIARVKVRKGIVVTDDRAARDCCAGEGVSVTGTIGILKACCKSGALSPAVADVVLQAMIDAGYHAPVNSISGLL